MNRDPLPAKQPDYHWHALTARAVIYKWHMNRKEDPMVKLLVVRTVTVEGTHQVEVGFLFHSGQPIEVITDEEKIKSTAEKLETDKYYTTMRGLKLGWDRDGYYGDSLSIYLDRDKNTLRLITILHPYTRYRPSVCGSAADCDHNPYGFYHTCLQLESILGYHDIPYAKETYNDQPYQWSTGIPEVYLNLLTPSETIGSEDYDLPF